MSSVSVVGDLRSHRPWPGPELSGEGIVEAIRAQGEVQWRIVWRHILPNILSPLIDGSHARSTYDHFRIDAKLPRVGIQPPILSWGGMLAMVASICRVRVDCQRFLESPSCLRL